MGIKDLMTGIGADSAESLGLTGAADEIRPIPPAPQPPVYKSQLPASAVSRGEIAGTFGKHESDFIQYYVYDSDGNFITSKIKTGGSRVDLVKLNPGQDLRDCGLIAGKYRIEYNFLRQRGGKPRVIFQDEEDQIWNGQIREENGRYFKGIELDNNNPTTKEEVFIFDDTYMVHEISPSRQEVRIVAKDSDIAEYNNGFASLLFKEFRYNPILTDIAGDGKIDSNDPFKFVATLDDSDAGFKEEMVGGYIEIPNAFITGYEETVNYIQKPNPNYVNSTNTNPENKFVDSKEAQKEKQDAARAAAIDPSSIEDSPGEQTPMTQAAASNNPKTSGGGSSGMAAVLDMMDDG
tara:strand:+ start:2163 stop:3209 length:1047 start_codon:yes stop_codon:yes gene_type:complete